MNYLRKPERSFIHKRNYIHYDKAPLPLSRSPPPLFSKATRRALPRRRRQRGKTGVALPRCLNGVEGGRRPGKQRRRGEGRADPPTRRSVRQNPSRLRGRRGRARVGLCVYN